MPSRSCHRCHGQVIYCPNDSRLWPPRARLTRSAQMQAGRSRAAMGRSASPVPHSWALHISMARPACAHPAVPASCRAAFVGLFPLFTHR